MKFFMPARTCSRVKPKCSILPNDVCFIAFSDHLYFNHYSICKIRGKAHLILTPEIAGVGAHRQVVLDLEGLPVLLARSRPLSFRR